MTDRPDCIAHWTEIDPPAPWHYSGDDEAMGYDAAFSPRFDMTLIGVHHLRLPPGHRSSYPHAESTEEEFVYVLEGAPDVWLDGTLHRLRPGDGVGFPAGTGLCHSFLNNTDAEVRLLVVGERPRADNRILYPLNPEQRPRRSDWWEDAPARPMGGHDGLPDRVRIWRSGGPRP